MGHLVHIPGASVHWVWWNCADTNSKWRELSCDRWSHISCQYSGEMLVQTSLKSCRPTVVSAGWWFAGRLMPPTSLSRSQLLAASAQLWCLQCLFCLLAVMVLICLMEPLLQLLMYLTLLLILEYGLWSLSKLTILPHTFNNYQTTRNECFTKIDILEYGLWSLSKLTILPHTFNNYQTTRNECFTKIDK